MTKKRPARRAAAGRSRAVRASGGAGARRRRLDPATRYATDVCEGRIVAGRAVRLACARHLRDLSCQRSAAFPYYFDTAAAQHIIDFFPEFLTLEDGRPFVLPAWLQFCYGCMFGWKRQKDDLRRFVYGYFETSKGSGKSPSAAGVGLYCQTFDDEPYGEIYSAAFDKGQASIILNDAIRMAEASPDLQSEGLEIGKYNIANLPNGSFFRAVSSEHRGKSGPRPSVVLGDEIHEHRDGRVINKLVAGFKGRRQPLALLFTNSGSDKNSYCWELHQKSLDVLEGVIVDEQWFGYVCHLDPCAQCFADGYRQPRDGCRACDDWTNPAVWLKVAPALGVVIQPKYLQDALEMAQSVPSEWALKRRLNFCIWTETHQIWIAPDAWKACEVASVSERNDGRACALGFDMSEKIDLTSGVVALRVDDEPARPADEIELLDMDGDQEVRKPLTINFSVELVPFFWIPADTLTARQPTERVLYEHWHRQGFLQVTPGPVVDHDLIFEQVRDDIGKRFKPQRVGYDAHNATQFAVALRDRAKFTIADVPQGRKLSETFKLFEALVLLRRIRHAGNPVLAYCVANAEAKRDRYQNLWVEKPSRLKRIDGLMAAVIALNQLVLLPARPRRRRGAMVWTPGGFVPAAGTGGAEAQV